MRIAGDSIVKNILKVALLTLLISALPCGLYGKSIKLATLNWEPYIGTELVGQGYVARLIRSAFEGSGYEPELKFYPWARVIHIAEQKEYAGYFPEYYSESVAGDYLFSDPFPAGVLVFFKKKSRSISFPSLESLKPYSIGVVKGYVNTAAFDQADYLKKVEGVDDLRNLKKLLNGWLDLVIIDRYVGEYLLDTYLADRKDEIDFLFPPLGKKQLYICIAKDYPGAEKIIAGFNAGLQKMKKDGRLQELIETAFFQGTGDEVLPLQ